MKAKYLIAMLAVPTMFAACSQDEFEVNGTAPEAAIVGTPYGDNLVFNLEGDADTRLTTSGNWEEGDQIGMIWVSDQYNVGGSMEPSTAVVQGFSSATNVLGNTPLNFLSGTSFKANTMLFVGTYIAYYPFDDTFKQAGVMSLGVGQKQTSKDLAYAYKNHMVLTSDTVTLAEKNAGTGQTPSINLRRLSNLMELEFSLKEDKDNYPEVKIEKIEVDIKDASNSLLAYAKDILPNKWVKGYTNSGEAGDKTMKDLVSSNEYVGDNSTPAKGVITVTPEEPVVISKEQGGKIYLAFMPSAIASVDRDNTTFKVYTNYGVVEFDNDSNNDANVTFKTLKSGSTTEFEAKKLDEMFSAYDKKAGQLIKAKAIIDITKVNVDELTATNAEEVRNIIDNWKRKGTTGATPITINLAHDDSYDAANENKATAENIVLDGLDLSDIPADLTIATPDTLEFTGATNLKAAKKIIIDEATLMTNSVSGAAALVFNGTTQIGDLTTADGGIYVNENTTVYDELKISNAAAEEVEVAQGKNLTVDSGKITITITATTINNLGEISVINSGSINDNTNAGYLTINNGEDAVPGTSAEVVGTINVGDEESQGYVYATAITNSANSLLRFYNGDFAPAASSITTGTVIAVANNALSFAAAADKVTTIEVIGEIKFGAFDLTADAGKALNVILKSNGKLNMGAKTITLGSVTVEENATISGTKLIVFKNGTNTGELTVNKDAVLTVDADTEINANVLNLPTGAKIEGDATTSKVVYKTAGQVGGTYTANVSQKSNLSGVE